MYLFDTDTLTHLYAGNANVVGQLQSTDDPEIGTTIITRVELVRGRIDFLLKAATGTDVVRAHQLLVRTEDLLAHLFVAPFDRAAAAQFDQLRMVKAYRKIGRADLLIASIALANRATLVTRNLRHFRQISTLQVVNWVD